MQPAETPVEGLTVRPARAEELDRIAEILGGEPGPEGVGLAGDPARARRLMMGIVRLKDSPQGWQHSVVAALDGRVVGVLQAGAAIPELRITPPLAFLALRLFRLGIFDFLRRLRATDRVHFSRPAGSYYVAELFVDPALRSRGIGGVLLDFAEERARAGGHDRMSLTTTLVNPARRLYERHGFRVVETKTDPEYERVTGIPGRILMVKELPGQ